MQVRREWGKIYKVLGKKHQTKILYLVSKNNKDFLSQTKIEGICCGSFAFQEMFKKFFRENKTNIVHKPWRKEEC